MDAQCGANIPTMLGLKDAAKATGLPYSCLRRWIKSGTFTHYVKSGNRYLINFERLVVFLNSDSKSRL